MCRIQSLKIQGDCINKQAEAELGQAQDKLEAQVGGGGWLGGLKQNQR